jgi:hypothetical protein
MFNQNCKTAKHAVICFQSCPVDLGLLVQLLHLLLQARISVPTRDIQAKPKQVSPQSPGVTAMIILGDFRQFLAEKLAFF